MRAVEHVPRAAAPAAERHPIRAQRRAARLLDEPVLVLLEDRRPGLGDKWRDPDRRLKAARPDLIQHRPHVAAKRGAGGEPVAHRALIAVVDLHVGQRRQATGDRLQVVEYLLGRHARTEAVPRAPTRWWSLAGSSGTGYERRMMDAQPIGELVEQPCPARTAADHQLLERPALAWSKREPFGVDHRGKAGRRQAGESKATAEAETRRKRANG